MSARHSPADAELIRQVVALGCREPRFDRSQEPVAFEAWAARAVAVVAARYTPDLPARRAEADRHASLRQSHPRRSIVVRIRRPMSVSSFAAQRVPHRQQALNIGVEQPFAVRTCNVGYSSYSTELLSFSGSNTEHQLVGDLLGRVFANVGNWFISHINSPLDRGLPQPASYGGRSLGRYDAFPGFIRGAR